MLFRKVVCMTLFVCIALAGSSGVLQPLHQLRPMLNADGGAPEPPVPKPPMLAPSNQPNLMLLADGGAPEPPVPPKVLASSIQPNLMLLADGGAPEPPVPPKCLLPPSSLTSSCWPP